MRQLITALLAAAPLALASQTVFSVHDDLLAFPQYEVIFSDSFISKTDADLILELASSTIHNPPKTSNQKTIESDVKAPHSSHPDHDFHPADETYEIMYANDERYLCTIPIVELPPKNKTSESEARAAEQKELARATDRGWELLQDLEGSCLYFVSGWWSYSFCYNAEIVQFHQLAPQPGKPIVPPQRDPNTKQYVLGKVKTSQAKEDEWGNAVGVHKGSKYGEPPNTELQVKGDTRYLVQRMDGGTTCDLTGKPRRIEVQFHCNPHVTDRIGYVKEVTTCSYLMVVYTPRLCNDVAFMPPKENKANEIVCRVIVPEEDLADRTELKTLEAELDAANIKADKKINVGGVIVGGGTWVGKEGQRMPIPANFGQENQGRAVEVIARKKSKADGGQVEVLSDEELEKLGLDPSEMGELTRRIQEMAQGKGWKIEVVDAPGEMQEIIGIVENEEDEEEGSEEILKDEL